MKKHLSIRFLAVETALAFTGCCVSSQVKVPKNVVANKVHLDVKSVFENWSFPKINS
jgi:hypothetical protein